MCKVYADIFLYNMIVYFLQTKTHRRLVRDKNNDDYNNSKK